MQRVAVLLLTVSTVACAGAAAENAEPSHPVAVFPTQAELQAIPAAKVAPEAFDLDNVQVESWNYESATSAAGADVPYDDSSPWTALLKDAVGAVPAGRARLSAPLRCAAEQAARFHLKHGKLPSRSWQRFTVARCGSAAPLPVSVAWSSDVPREVTDAQLVDAFRKTNGFALANAFGAPGGPDAQMAVGLAAVREGNRLGIGFVVARDTVRLDGGSLQADGRRRVNVRGTLRAENTEAIMGLVNQGKYGVRECVNDARAAPPYFSFSCEMAEGDKWAWVDVVARKRERALSSTVGHVLVTAAGENLPQEYTAPRGSGEPAPVRTIAEFRHVLVDRLNRVRAEGRLRPLTLSAEQSATSERLAGVVIDPSTKGERESLADRAAIGLLAGWDVRGLIRGGWLFVGTAPSTHDAGVWLDFALERPIGRQTLLEPQSQVVAVGPAMPDSVEALGAVVTTYSLFDKADHSAEAQRVFSAVAAARVQRGLSEPVRLVNVPGLADQAALVRADKKTPKAAFNDVLEYIAEHLRGERIQGFMFETIDVDRLLLPKELFAPGPLQLVVEVTHHRAPGAAWGQYVVYVFARSNPGAGARYDALTEHRDGRARL